MNEKFIFFKMSDPTHLLQQVFYLLKHLLNRILYPQ